MRKSRLRLFKSTSMLISVVGIIMIISTVIIVGWLAYAGVSEGITTEISSGNQYDQLAELKTSYNNLSAKFDSVKATYYAGSYDDIQKYNDARLELTRAKTAIDNVESGLNGEGISSNEIDSRIDFAKQKLQDAEDAYNTL